MATCWLKLALHLAQGLSPWRFASSAISGGWSRLGEAAKRVIERNFRGFKGAKAVQTSSVALPK